MLTAPCILSGGGLPEGNPKEVIGLAVGLTPPSYNEPRSWHKAIKVGVMVDNSLQNRL